MTAIFGTPLAAILLAVEVLLFEWKPRSLVPVMIGVLVALAWRPALIGSGPMFPFEATTPGGWQVAALAVALGVSVALAATPGIAFAQPSDSPVPRSEPSTTSIEAPPTGDGEVDPAEPEESTDPDPDPDPDADDPEREGSDDDNLLAAEEPDEDYSSLDADSPGPRSGRRTPAPVDDEPVAAEDEATARRACQLIEVAYEELSAVLTIEEALAPDAPIIHPRLAEYFKVFPAIFKGNSLSYTEIAEGDVAHAWRDCEVIVEGEFETPAQAHLAMEPCGALAEVEPLPRPTTMPSAR